LAHLLPQDRHEVPICKDLLAPNDVVVLVVVPVDSAAPKGRLILPSNKLSETFWMLALTLL
jgi:hypothetical protein